MGRKCEVCNLGVVANFTCTYCKIKFCPKCGKVNDLSISRQCNCPPPVQWVSDEKEPK